ncbi:MAG: bis(5'-nucleosyl)-tetraphosphatase [Candidatus Anstonellaceae archaeon]
MEKSCGAVIFSQESGRRLYLLLHYEEGHWDFPKGHNELGESEEETARREIREETGITQIEFLPNFRKTISYFYQRKGKKIFKEAVFFLAKALQTKVSLSHEHVGYVWLDAKEAEKKITYQNSKEVLREAEKFLSSRT